MRGPTKPRMANCHWDTQTVVVYLCTFLHLLFRPPAGQRRRYLCRGTRTFRVLFVGSAPEVLSRHIPREEAGTVEQQIEADAIDGGAARGQVLPGAGSPCIATVCARRRNACCHSQGHRCCLPCPILCADAHRHRLCADPSDSSSDLCGLQPLLAPTVWRWRWLHELCRSSARQGLRCLGRVLHWVSGARRFV